jgi:copper chaperone CopZ
MLKKELPVTGMHCASCESRIEKALQKLPGIHKVKASYVENMVYIEYHPDQCHPEDINRTITAIGEYTIGSTTRFASNSKNLAGILTIFFAILMLGEYTGGLDMSAALREEVTYSVLFVIGLFTSLHCVGVVDKLDTTDIEKIRARFL